MEHFLLFMTGRDLQRMSGNITAKVGFLSTEEISRLDASSNLGISGDELKVPTVHEALTFVSSSVRLVILDVKVGPPSFENDLAKNVLSVVRKSGCKNCLIWAKSDTVSRDIVSLTEDAMVGYIVMKDPLTGATSDLLRMKGAQVAGIYHPLIDKMLVEILHRNGKKVYAWTVDDADSMRKLLIEGVDGIVTGLPSLLQQVMHSMKAECLEEGFALP